MSTDVPFESTAIGRDCMLDDECVSDANRMTSFCASAVIVGCLPPFKSLFKSQGSFQNRRQRSLLYDKNMSSGLRLNAMRLDSAGTDGSAEAATKAKSRPIDGGQHVFDCGRGGRFDVPRGAIGVRSDYVSRTWVLWGRSWHD